MGKRSQFEAKLDTLWAIKQGCELKTTIMYKTNQNWVSLNHILSILSSAKLIFKEQHGKRYRYFPTSEGVIFLAQVSTAFRTFGYRPPSDSLRFGDMDARFTDWTPSREIPGTSLT